MVKGDPNPNGDNADRGKRTDPNGKLYKRLLRERYWTGHESRVI